MIPFSLLDAMPVAEGQSVAQALAIYQRAFRPSDTLARPHVMAAFNVFAADTNEKAELIFSCVTHDHDARKRSFAIAAEVMVDMVVPA